MRLMSGVDRDPLNTINPNDIESIEVLKDASAAAIYGAFRRQRSGAHHHEEWTER